MFQKEHIKPYEEDADAQQVENAILCYSHTNS